MQGLAEAPKPLVASQCRAEMAVVPVSARAQHYHFKTDELVYSWRTQFPLRMSVTCAVSVAGPTRVLPLGRCSCLVLCTTKGYVGAPTYP